MFTNAEAEQLIKIPKKILGKDELLDKINIDKNFPFKLKYKLFSEQANEYIFLLDIKQSEKNVLKISLSCLENNSKIGLIRIDYNGKHSNPTEKIKTLPQKFHKYIGKRFNFDEHHIHYYVQGYKDLAWALPLKDMNVSFPIKNITDAKKDIVDVTKEFYNLLNIETNLLINELLL